MADYYPLIARAVAGLEKNTGEARRTIYERARAALVGQLRSVTPALDESDVTRERLALEEAIRKVEAESARRSTARTDPAARMRPPEFPRREEPQPAPESASPSAPRRPPPMPRPEGRPAAGAGAAARARVEPRFDDPGEQEPSIPVEPGEQMLPQRPQIPRPDTRPAAPAPAAWVKPEPRSVEPNDDPSPRPEAAPPEPPRGAGRPAGERPAGERPAGERRSLANSGLRDFREVVSEADELGGASARANKSARDSFAAVPASTSEPHRAQERAHDERAQERTPKTDEAFLALDDTAEQEMLEPSFIVDETRPVPPRARQAPRAEIETEVVPRRSRGDMIRIASAGVILCALLVLMAWAWPSLVEFYRALWTPATTTEAVKESPPVVASKPKIADRIEPGGQPQPAVSEAASVAQRVVLYEEDPTDTQGKRAVGSAVWRTETISPGPGKPPELAVRADIEIPERKISMTWTLRRDTDPNRSTSHTIEIMFKLPPDFPSGGIFNVPGIWMKQAEQTQGTALAGLAVKVTAGYFLIGLSSAPTDQERNIQLLKERPWFDIPIVYTNNRRAILAMEKGTPGERAFQRAFAAWEK
jgi:hypothetical protein